MVAQRGHHGTMEIRVMARPNREMLANYKLAGTLCESGFIAERTFDPPIARPYQSVSAINTCAHALDFTSTTLPRDEVQLATH